MSHGNVDVIVVEDNFKNTNQLFKKVNQAIRST
jgi:hypothetical protein